MSDGEIFQPPTRGSIIADRIGPIFDSAFLKLISKEKIKELVVIQLRAQTRAIQEELKAVEQITKLAEEVQVK